MPIDLSGNRLELGSLASGDRLTMWPHQRSRHLYIVGASGAGKSKFLEHLIRQDIKAWRDSGCGVLLLDPHGAIYDGLMRHLATAGSAALKRPVVPIDLTQDAWVVAYNLLQRRSTASADVVIGGLMSAIVHVFGTGSLWQTPLLARWLHNTLRLLYDEQLTLPDLTLLLDDPAVRRKLIDNTRDGVARGDWQRAARYRPERFEEEIGSTLNRLTAFIRNERLGAAFGQTDGSLDLRRAIDEGWIILVNCSQSRGKMTAFDCQLFATMMLSDLWTVAREREKGKGRPFYVYIDEFQNVVSESIAESLDQARGFGLHLTLSHQFPKQLINIGSTGEKIHDSVLANAGSKVVFRTQHPSDLETLAGWLHMQTFDPDKVQLELHTTKVVGTREETRVIETHSRTRSESSSYGKGEDDGRSQSRSSTQRQWPDGRDETSSMIGEQSGESRRTSLSIDESSSEGESSSTAEVPVFVPIYDMERSSVTLESLDVQRHRRMQEIAGLPDRTCIVRLEGERLPVRLRTIDVAERNAQPGEITAFVDTCCERLAFALRFEEAKARLLDRQQRVAENVALVDADEPTTARRRLRPPVS